MNLLSQKTCSTIFESEARWGAVVLHLSSEPLLRKILAQLECQKSWKHETASKEKVWERSNTCKILRYTWELPSRSARQGGNEEATKPYLVHSTKQNYVNLKLNLILKMTNSTVVESEAWYGRALHLYNDLLLRKILDQLDCHQQYFESTKMRSRRKSKNTKTTFKKILFTWELRSRSARQGRQKN